MNGVGWNEMSRQDRLDTITIEMERWRTGIDLPGGPLSQETLDKWESVMQTWENWMESNAMDLTLLSYYKKHEDEFNGACQAADRPDLKMRPEWLDAVKEALAMIERFEASAFERRSNDHL